MGSASSGGEAIDLGPEGPRSSVGPGVGPAERPQMGREECLLAATGGAAATGAAWVELDLERWGRGGYCYPWNIRHWDSAGGARGNIGASGNRLEML